jgi:hypothetical protein
MKKTGIVMFMVLAFAAAAAAHPPSDIIITFDLAKSAVMANIAHDTKDTGKHYIGQIIVMVNGKEMIKQKAETQTNNDGQNVMYVIPGLKTGDKVAIAADCSVFGGLTKETVIKTKEQPQETKRPSSAKPEANASSKFKLK